MRNIKLNMYEEFVDHFLNLNFQMYDTFAISTHYIIFYVTGYRGDMFRRILSTNGVKVLWNRQDIRELIKRKIIYRPKIISEENEKWIDETEIKICIKKLNRCIVIYSPALNI